MKKYLEYKDDKSNKFWEITVTGNSHTVRYGKIGTEGQSKTKEFSSDEEALKDAEKLYASKIKKGYIKVKLPVEEKNITKKESKIEINNTNMLKLIKNDDLKNVKYFVENGFDINKICYYGKTPLQLAIEQNKKNIAEYLINKSNDINIKGDDPKYHVLYLALYNGNEDLVNILISKGASLSESLMFESAVLGGITSIVKKMIDNGSVDPNKEIENEGKPFYISIEKGYDELSRYLFKKCEKMDPADQLWHAVDGGLLWVVEDAVNKGADVNYSNEYGNSIIIKAARSGNLNLIKYLVKKGADINKNKKDRSPLTAAIDNMHEEAAKYFIDNGAELEKKDSLGRTPFQCACSQNMTDLVKVLLEMGANVNVYCNQKWTPLIHAVENNNIEIFKLLIEKGADINSQNEFGVSPLIAAVQTKDIDKNIISILLENGADVNMKTKKGKTAVDCTNDKEIITLINKYGGQSVRDNKSEEKWNIDKKYLSKPAKNPLKFLSKDKKADVVKIQKAWDDFIKSKRTAYSIKLEDDPKDNIHSSKHGGTPLFPKSKLKDWPICADCGEEMVLKYQLRQKDVGALLCPDDTDMLLVFWCPDECGEEEVEHTIIWQKESDIIDPIDKSLGEPLPAKKCIFKEIEDYVSVQEYGENMNFDYFELGLDKCEVEIDNKKMDFFDAWENFNHRDEKVGGFADWVQCGGNCCGESPHLILQTEWAEGYWYIFGCVKCGDLITEYQGT